MLSFLCLFGVKGQIKKSSAFRKEYRGREIQSRGTTSVRRHFTITAFSGTNIPQFCNGNSRCILLRIYPIQRTANRMNSRRTFPLPRTNRQLSDGAFQPTGFCSSHLMYELYHVTTLKSIVFLNFFDILEKFLLLSSTRLTKPFFGGKIVEDDKLVFEGICSHSTPTRKVLRSFFKSDLLRPQAHRHFSFWSFFFLCL